MENRAIKRVEAMKAGEMDALASRGSVEDMEAVKIQTLRRERMGQ